MGGFSFLYFMILKLFLLCPLGYYSDCSYILDLKQNKQEKQTIEKEEEKSDDGWEYSEKCHGWVMKVGWDNSEIQKIAWEKANCDESVVRKIDGENGMWDHDRRHNPALNVHGVDWGYCGMNDYWHPEIVHDDRFLYDPMWQLDECIRLITGGRDTFYAPLSNNIKFKYEKIAQKTVDIEYSF